MFSDEESGLLDFFGTTKIYVEGMKMAVKRAIVSVSDKLTIVQDVVGLIQAVRSQGDDLLVYSTGGTATLLRESGLKIHDVKELTGGDELFGDLVKTLSREVAAGLLAQNNHQAELEDRRMAWVDILMVDFYALEEAIKEKPDDYDYVRMKTDVGGPTMAHEGAKGESGRILICRAEDRQRVIAWIRAGYPDREDFLRELYARADFEAARHIGASAVYKGQGQFYAIFGEKVVSCKGENGSQSPAGLYKTHDDPLALHKFKLMAGAELSEVNWTDVDRLLQSITHVAAGFDINFGYVPQIAIGVKHGNACGAAVGEDVIEVTKKMVAGDLISIFGGLVMLNYFVTEEVAEVLLSYSQPDGTRRILDGIMAPGFAPEAIEMLKRSKDRCRFLANPHLGVIDRDSLDTEPLYRPVRGGFLLQGNYTFILDLSASDLEMLGDFPIEEQKNMVLAKAICDTSNSNTIDIVTDSMLIGNGVGQQDRVGGATLAVDRAIRAGHIITGAVACSDSFFPFTDGLQTLIDAGVKFVFSTSGSKGDAAVKKLAEETGTTIVMGPDSKYRGFCGH